MHCAIIVLQPPLTYLRKPFNKVNDSVVATSKTAFPPKPLKNERRFADVAIAL